jgi:hypothetical protein
MYWKQESADKFSNAMTAAKFEGREADGGRDGSKKQKNTNLNNCLRKKKIQGKQTTTES